jgi:hypothetical protein
VVAALAGCAAPAGNGPPGASPAETAAAASGPSVAHGATMGGPGGCPMMSAGCAGALRPGAMQAMCEMRRNLDEAPNEQARQAMMERGMPGMSPEQRRKHMEMMRRHCP